MIIFSSKLPLHAPYPCTHVVLQTHVPHSHVLLSPVSRLSNGSVLAAVVLFTVHSRLNASQSSMACTTANTTVSMGTKPTTWYQATTRLGMGAEEKTMYNYTITHSSYTTASWTKSSLSPRSGGSWAPAIGSMGLMTTKKDQAESSVATMQSLSDATTETNTTIDTP